MWKSKEHKVSQINRIYRINRDPTFSVLKVLFSSNLLAFEHKTLKLNVYSWFKTLIYSFASSNLGLFMFLFRNLLKKVSHFKYNNLKSIVSWNVYFWRLNFKLSPWNTFDAHFSWAWSLRRPVIVTRFDWNPPIVCWLWMRGGMTLKV